MFKTYHFTSDVISQLSETFQLHFFFLFLRLRSLQVDTLAIVLLKNQDITSLSDRYRSTSFDACTYFAQLKDEKESVERVHLFQLYLNIQTQKRKFLGQFIPATNPNKNSSVGILYMVSLSLGLFQQLTRRNLNRVCNILQYIRMIISSLKIV